MFVALPIRHELGVILVSYPISWVLTSLLFLIYYKRGRWIRQGFLPPPDAAENTAKQ